MIAYIIPENPDDRLLAKASQILNSGGLLCLPLDTNWIVIADPFIKVGVEKLYRFRHVDNTKHFTIFCANFAQAAEIAHINDQAFRLLRRVVPGPYTFIFKAQKKIIRHLKASKMDHEVGLRFPSSSLLQTLLERHGGVAIGTHVTADMFPDHDPEIPIWSGLIDDNFAGQFEMILDAGETNFIGPTTIISLSEDVPALVREGTGSLAPFGL